VTPNSGSNQDDDLEHLLEDLVSGTDSLTAALLRLDGTCLCAAGDTAQTNIKVLSWFVAEMISRCRSVAHVVGEDRFSTVVQHGADRHVQVTLVGDAHALVVAFADDRQTGLVRLLSGRAAVALEHLLPSDLVSQSPGPGSTIPASIAPGADLIDRIFAEPHPTKHEPDRH
jgi:hypothetical protein